MNQHLKLGKLAPRHDPRLAMFAQFRKGSIGPMPAHPKQFGHENIIRDWGMLGNDVAGDCVFAGAAHETMMLTALPGGVEPARFTEDCVLSDYSAVTGYDARVPSSDQGTVVAEAMGYRVHTGIVDAHGQRHKLGGYLALEPGNLDDLHEALWLFGAVGIGIEFPDYAMEQFERGRKWSYRRGGRIDGGHYVPLVALRAGGSRTMELVCVTWGKTQHITEAFYKRYCDEAYAYVTTDMMDDHGKSPQGFDMEALRQYLIDVSR